ncbi:hypothetical protein D3C73_1498870 [compost metagenome]
MRICRGTICDPWLARAAAVAYDENALANSSSRLARNEGASTGMPMRSQKLVLVPPSVRLASAHCGLRAASAGMNVMTMSGIWK